MALRHGFHYEKTKWTGPHLKALRELELSELDRVSLNEYLTTYEQLLAKIELFDTRIEELSHKPAYDAPVTRPACFCGISRQRAAVISTALLLLRTLRRSLALCPVSSQAVKGLSAPGLPKQAMCICAGSLLRPRKVFAEVR